MTTGYLFLFCLRRARRNFCEEMHTFGRFGRGFQRIAVGALFWRMCGGKDCRGEMENQHRSQICKGERLRLLYEEDLGEFNSNI